MSELFFTTETELNDLDISLRRLDKKTILPPDLQSRVDSNWKRFSEKQISNSGKSPTKGKICVLNSWKPTLSGLQGECSDTTFDRVLYFARTEIPEADYNFGRTQIGFPLASWAVMRSSDNNLLFCGKKGAEGAYEGTPYSAFGGLANGEKDFPNDEFCPISFLQRTVGDEIGNKLWDTISNIEYCGMGAHDENSSKVNNGYDTIWSVEVDVDSGKLEEILTNNPQFTKEIKLVHDSPGELTRFLIENPTTHSATIGVFGYIAASSGKTEALKQYTSYKSEKKCPVNLTFLEILE
jgi:hypothetical protein